MAAHNRNKAKKSFQLPAFNFNMKIDVRSIFNCLKYYNLVHISINVFDIWLYTWGD